MSHLILFLDKELIQHKISLYSLFYKIIIIDNQNDIYFHGTPTFLVFTENTKQKYNTKSATQAYIWSDENDYEKINKLTKNYLKVGNFAADVIVFDVDDTLITEKNNSDVVFCKDLELLCELKKANPSYLIGIWSHGTTNHIKYTKNLYNFTWDFILTRKEHYVGTKFAAYLLYCLNSMMGICSLNSAILIDDTKPPIIDYSTFIHIKTKKAFSFKSLYNQLSKIINNGSNKYNQEFK